MPCVQQNKRDPKRPSLLLFGHMVRCAKMVACERALPLKGLVTSQDFSWLVTKPFNGRACSQATNMAATSDYLNSLLCNRSLSRHAKRQRTAAQETTTSIKWKKWLVLHQCACVLLLSDGILVPRDVVLLASSTDRKQSWPGQMILESSGQLRSRKVWECLERSYHFRFDPFASH